MPPIVDAVTARLTDSTELHDALARVEKLFQLEVASHLPELEVLCQHIERFRGKMLRPTLVLLSGLATGKLRDEHITLACVVEMVHMATLVHDDVLDASEIRRRGKTVNAMHGNETAVLLGDYLIASSYRLCSTLDSQRYALRIAEMTRRTCEGELLQLHHRGDLHISEETYLEIIDRKTASLIGASCELGSMASGASIDVSEGLREFGRRLGIAFQVQDDILDLFSQERAVGKSVGRDIRLGTMTLPAIHLLAGLSGESRSDAESRIRDAMQGQDQQQVIELLRLHKADESAAAFAQQQVELAKSSLAVLSPGIWSELLADLADASIDRES
jgi:octaprenyl-diphosphate synthase